jgi:hypothetical protein
MKLSKRLLGFSAGAILGMNLCLFPFSAPADPPAPSSSV